MRRFLRANPATAVTRTTLAVCELPLLRRPLSCPIATLSVAPSSSSLWVAHRTCSSSATPSTTSAGLAHRGNDHSSHSREGGADLAHIGEGEERGGAEEEVENGSFDACEAACQELHDVTHAMIGHLRRTATIGDPQVLTHRRIPKRMFFLVRRTTKTKKTHSCCGIKHLFYPNLTIRSLFFFFHKRKK